MASQIQKTKNSEQKVKYDIPTVVCAKSSLALMTKAYVLTASKIARQRLGLPGKIVLLAPNKISENFFNKKYVGRVELDVLNPKLPNMSDRHKHIIGQIKARFCKSIGNFARQKDKNEKRQLRHTSKRASSKN